MPDWKVTRTPPTTCPACSSPLDAASHPHAKPKQGDLSICIRCGSPLIFDASMRLMLLSPVELLALPPDVQAEIRRYQMVQQRVVINHQKPKQEAPDA